MWVRHSDNDLFKIDMVIGCWKILKDPELRTVYGGKAKAYRITAQCIFCQRINENMTVSKFKKKSQCYCTKARFLLDNGKKKCSKCLISKEELCFNKQTSAPDGFYNKCIQCVTKSRMLIKYKMTSEQYDKIITDVNICEICELLLDGDKKKNNRNYVCIDHYHTTGKIIGILCDRCNIALGGFKDDLDILKKAAKYLEKHKEP